MKDRVFGAQCTTTQGEVNRFAAGGLLSLKEDALVQKMVAELREVLKAMIERGHDTEKGEYTAKLRIVLMTQEEFVGHCKDMFMRGTSEANKP